MFCPFLPEPLLLAPELAGRLPPSRGNGKEIDFTTVDFSALLTSFVPVRFWFPFFLPCRLLPAFNGGPPLVLFPTLASALPIFDD